MHQKTIYSIEIVYENKLQAVLLSCIPVYFGDNVVSENKQDEKTNPHLFKDYKTTFLRLEQNQ